MTSPPSGPVLETLIPSSHDLGDFTVRRSLPAKARTMVGPFVFYDEAGPATLAPSKGIDVRPHPHIGLATVTYMLKGAFVHRDSLGSTQLIEPGAINLMTAGRGIVHSERSPDDARAAGGDLWAIQTWLALPDGQEERDPAFEHVPQTRLPVIAGDGAQARIIMGTLWGETAPVTTYAGTIYADIALEPGGAIPIDALADERALYVLSGDASLNGDALAPGALHVLRPGVAATLRSQYGARVMLCGGEAFATPRHVWWNFVSSSKDRIVQARQDWEAMRFPLIPDDNLEYIPLPHGRPKTVSYP
ncbi:pirin family protein [Sphingobium fluviale]|uniref:Pirin family protein n=1 Tax=Sphingobium fluviale TaxID=2506423 RepID=A0A4V1N3C7_9SPHN|nr:pirin family protein [Sphingobium fluviale]RXR28206.1 pirin family protein [Sphingobium fluviale]